MAKRCVNLWLGLNNAGKIPHPYPKQRQRNDLTQRYLQWRTGIPTYKIMRCKIQYEENNTAMNEIKCKQLQRPKYFVTAANQKKTEMWDVRCDHVLTRPQFRQFVKIYKQIRILCIIFEKIRVRQGWKIPPFRREIARIPYSATDFLQIPLFRKPWWPPLETVHYLCLRLAPKRNKTSRICSHTQPLNKSKK